MAEGNGTTEYSEFDNFSGRLEHVSCPICENPPVPRLLFKRPDGVGFWYCPECDVQYASPRFTPGSLLEISENEEFIDLSFYDAWSYDRWKKENRNRSYLTQRLKIETLSRFISEKDRVLDVGCGTGLFCLEALKSGLTVEGIEPSKMLVDIGREVLNVQLNHGLIENFNPGYRYNAIVIWDVLEHVYNPVELVERCSHLLNEGGYLFLQVPNYAGISNRYKSFLCRRGLKKSGFQHYGFPWHIYFFNKKSLTSLLTPQGFTPILFESWSHHLKDGTDGLLANIMIALSKKFYLSDYITCLARKIT